MPVGSVRGRLDAIDTRIAIADDGMLYAGRRISDDEWTLVSFDPCLNLRWEVPTGVRATRDDVEIMIDARGDIWLIAVRTPGVWRFDREGVLQPLGFEMPGRLWHWIGIPDSAGPVFATSSPDAGAWLHSVHANGGVTSVMLAEPSSYVYRDECLIVGDLLRCNNIAYDIDNLVQRWVDEEFLLLDGTFRHVVQPAAAFGRFWAFRYGIASYQLAMQDGEGIERATFRVARTTQGQVDLLVAPPVVTPRGQALVYMSGHREVPPDGQLQAIDEDLESVVWSLPAQRTRRGADPVDGIFSGETTHVVGRAEVVYLAVGASVYAVDERDGSLRWRVDALGDLNSPGTNLSPNGELYVHSYERSVFAIPTESAGLARSGWPIPDGTHRLNRSR